LFVGALALAVAPASAADVTAVDVGAETGLARDISTQGDNCWADFNKDGRPDLVLLNHGHVDGAQLFTDPGAGRFVLRTSFKKVDRNGNSWDWHSCAPADFDGDGDMDLYLGAGGCMGTCPSYPKSLYLQNPDGSFTDVAVAWGVTEPTGRGRSVAAFDANRDGRPDLFVGNEPPVDYPSPNRLYLNVGGTRMTDATAAWGLPVDAGLGGTCVEPGDYDGDGFTDVLVCGASRTYLYRNVGGTRFEDAGVAAGIVPTRALTDAAWKDMDGDGDLDLVQLTWNRVYVRRNVGGGHFVADDYSFGTGDGAVDLGTGDADGDADADVYVVVSKPAGATTNPPDRLLLNDGSGTRFSALPTPQVTAGNGDSATIEPDWRGSGSSLIVVNNGRAGSGPRQAIAVGAAGAVGGGPDLVVDSVSWEPASVSPDDPVTFSAVVSNTGSTATPDGVVLGVAFSVDGTKVSWTDTHVASLAAGSSVTLTADGGPSGSATWTAVVGSHTVAAFVDDVDRIAETDETDNHRSSSLTVGSTLTADAGPDQTGVARGAVVTLDGSGSASPDPDGTPLSFAWEQVGGPPAVIEDPSAAETTVQLPEAPGGTEFRFRLTVTTPSDESAVDEVLVRTTSK
jgi:hypothetical protein